MKKERRKTFEFGKIALSGGRKINPVTVDIRLALHGGEETFTVDKAGNKVYTGNKTPEYLEFTAMGAIWNSKKTDLYYGGQCLDTIAKYVKDPTFLEIYDLWKTYHLNGMHAGTPEQERALAVWQQAGHEYEYKTARQFLQSIGILKMPFYGKTIGKQWNGELYEYGTGWCIEDLPAEALERIEALLSA